MAQQSESFFELADLYRLPDDSRHYELSHGKLVSEPPPGAHHGRVTATIVTLLSNHVARRGLGVVLTCDAGFVLARKPDTLRAPDISFVAAARYAAITDESRWITGPPDLAVEVLSPSDRKGRVAAKLADYVDAKTPLLWIVDPRKETVQVCEAGCPPVLLHTRDQLTGSHVLPDFQMRVGDLFGTIATLLFQQGS